MIIMYTTGCPHCKTLASRLEANNIPYEPCSDMDIMRDKGFSAVPMLELEDGTIMNFTEALKWVNGQ